mgnify:CR=1 FL=1
MTEKELFEKAWMFLYAAAAENIGFTVKCVEENDQEGRTRGGDARA